MKKIISLLIVCLLVSLVGCGKPQVIPPGGNAPASDEEKGQKEDQTPSAQDEQKADSEETPEPEPAPAPEPEPEPEPEPVIESFRDFFEETDNKGVYVMNLSDSGLNNSELNYVGDRMLYVASDYGDSPAVMRLIDLDTGEIKTKRSTSYSPYSYDYVPINDEKFALFKNYEATFYVYNSRFELIDEIKIPGSPDVVDVGYDYDDTSYGDYDGDYDGGVYYASKVTPDGKYIWITDNRGSLKKYDVDTFELIAENNDVGNAYFTDSNFGDKYLALAEYSYKNDEFMTLIYDMETGEKITEFKNNGTVWFSPDGKRAVLCASDAGDSKLVVFDDVEAPTVPPVASGTAIEINSSDETYNAMIDWDDNVVVTYEYNYSQAGSVAEVNCYSLDTKKLISNYVIDCGSTGFSYAIDVKRNVFLATWFDGEGESHLYAWDYLNDDIESTGKYYKKYTSIPKKLADKRAEMEEKYDMYIYLGSECYVTDFDYRLERTMDFDRMYQVLCDVDEVFGLYPEGFFEQICIGNVKTLGIYLCGGFTKVSSYSADNAIALTMRSGYENTLALDINCDDALIKENVVHEISHWIDSRIDALQERGKFLDYDDEWDALNPKDFSYYYSYVDYNTRWEYIYDQYAKKKNKFYFTDSYSQTYPGEDRARLFEYLMYDTYDREYMSMPHARVKLGYYFKVIREVFDTTGWPAETAWEEKLRLANEKYAEESKEKKDKNKD